MVLKLEIKRISNKNQFLSFFFCVLTFSKKKKKSSIDQYL